MRARVRRDAFAARQSRHRPYGAPVCPRMRDATPAASANQLVLPAAGSSRCLPARVSSHHSRRRDLVSAVQRQLRPRSWSHVEAYGPAKASQPGEVQLSPCSRHPGPPRTSGLITPASECAPRTIVDQHPIDHRAALPYPRRALAVPTARAQRPCGRSGTEPTSVRRKRRRRPESDRRYLVDAVAPSAIGRHGAPVFRSCVNATTASRAKRGVAACQLSLSSASQRSNQADSRPSSSAASKNSRAAVASSRSHCALLRGPTSESVRQLHPQRVGPRKERVVRKQLIIRNRDELVV